MADMGSVIAFLLNTVLVGCFNFTDNFVILQSPHMSLLDVLCAGAFLGITIITYKRVIAQD